MTMRLRLPYPPSVNAYYRSPNKGALAGRTLISQEGRAYRVAVQAALLEQLGRAPQVADRLGVHIEAVMPDKRRRDIDNIVKAALDALTHAGLWLDDEQIDDLRIVRGQVGKPGHLLVRVMSLLPQSRSEALMEAF